MVHKLNSSHSITFLWSRLYIGCVLYLYIYSASADLRQLQNQLTTYFESKLEALTNMNMSLTKLLQETHEREKNNHSIMQNLENCARRDAIRHAKFMRTFDRFQVCQESAAAAGYRYCGRRCNAAAAVDYHSNSQGSY